jgi:hypothetical protein
MSLKDDLSFNLLVTCEMLRPRLSERGRRMFAVTQVRALGYGGLAAVARATGLAPSTIGRALKELAKRSGGGRAGASPRRRPQETGRSGFELDERPGTPSRAGDIAWPGAALAVGVQKPCQAGGGLQDMGHQVSSQTVGRLLRQLKFSRQGM